MRESFDMLVVGGGINGAGIARDAAGRGLSVCLCEQDDLAAHTSSASTKLIHGGLRYLQQGEVALVRKALNERETLRQLAPHLIAPTTFVLPHAACGCTTTWAAPIRISRPRSASTCSAIPAARRCSRVTGPASRMRTPASTMPGWWCSTHWMHTSAVPISAPAPAANS